MKEFKYILKVNPADPQKTLERLSELVTGKAETFADIDIEFVKSQEFITAVPVEVALTLSMRAQILYSNPECRFIITGVPSFRISNLIEYGYKVYNTKVDFNEKEETELDKCQEKMPCDGNEMLAPDIEGHKEGECPVEDEEQCLKDEDTKYFISGERVSKEEFLKKIEEVKENFRKTGFNLAGPIGKLFAWDIL